MAEITICVQDFIVKARRILKEKYSDPCTAIHVGSTGIIVERDENYKFGFPTEDEKRAQVMLQSLFNGETSMQFSYTGGQYNEGYGVDKESADDALRKAMVVVGRIRKIRSTCQR